MTIRNPIEWGASSLKLANAAVGTASQSIGHTREHFAALPTVRRIGFADLAQALARGLDDFAAYRTDVFFICAIYPVMGVVLGRLAFGYDMLPLIFPLISGFALIGPVAAVGLYEMSRRREQGAVVSWGEAFGVLRSPSIGAIVTLGLVLLALFAFWVGFAQMIYDVTLGPLPPESIQAFARDVVTTDAGWTMVAVGVGVGFLFAVAVLAISVVSFPLLIDRDVGLVAAIWTSLRAVARNPLPMAAWGLIVAGGLVIGSLPLLLGLIVVMPVLGHATWHLYRRLVATT
jgi:uncharacterized membrane protein